MRGLSLSQREGRAQVSHRNSRNSSATKSELVHLTKLSTERGNKLNIPIIHPTVWVIIVQHPYLLIKEHKD